ncbi:LytR family transcriptional regulator [Salicibibacter halophilus]|uniref:LytR family transcriptional regulator n=1 Tax=Salicibibacter halophilus TaxID=2502791 RepID=A0A514LJN9_9BACI|nr:LCP family protein [Salicibibacter halophilus]QDI92074.1 LytR family transcriptional regulator [Salicibibacter halophilus]
MKKTMIIVAIVVSALILVAGAFALYLYVSFSSTANDMHAPIDREGSNIRSEQINFEDNDPVSFLLLGLDAEEADYGRTDTMIVVTVNPGDQSMKMLSIPRDTNAELVGRGWNDKINHAYYYGGEKMAMDTVEHFLDVPIDYIVTVNMDGFEEMVDAVGGITVINDLEFEYAGEAFQKGELELSGKEALAFVRMRQDDPLGDSGRNERQRQVIEGVLREGANMSSVTSIGSILDAIGKNVQTNMEFQDMIDMQNYEPSIHDLEQLTLSGEHARLDGVYYYVVDELDKERVSNKLQEHLELD